MRYGERMKRLKARRRELEAMPYTPERDDALALVGVLIIQHRETLRTLTPCPNQLQIPALT